MENGAGHVLLCEEQLRTTLHCDDKEKLRRKLLLLQREYLRTAQRLQRAERSEAVRTHVRSRITQQNHQDQGLPEVPPEPSLKPSSLMPNGTTPAVPQCQGLSGGPTDSDSRRSPVIRFLLPTDAASPQSAGLSHRPSPAHRLGSRRSRLKWERRIAEAGGERREQSDRAEASTEAGSEGRVGNEETEAMNESEDLFSATESESLVFIQRNSGGQSEMGDVEGRGMEGSREQRRKETLGCDGKKEAVLCEEGRQEDAQKEKGEQGGEEGETSGGQRTGRWSECSSDKDAEGKAAGSEGCQDNTAEIKEGISETGGGEREAPRLLDSCTLVEGLLFPAEYYVRTTRRMTSTRSQPDMHAVILSQLSAGRHRRGRGSKRNAPKRGSSDQHAATDSSASPPSAPPREPQPVDSAAELSGQNSSKVFDRTSACEFDTGAFSSPVVTAALPARGSSSRKRRRSKGSSQTPRCSDDLRPTGSPVPSSDGPRREAPPEDPQPASSPSTATQTSPRGSGTPAASGNQVYPIFLKNASRTKASSRISANWRSLLLPSPATQTPLLPLPSLSLRPLVGGLANFDIQQDFHLPDDQFASLKLHKLCQVVRETGMERFASPSYNTRTSIRRFESYEGGPLPVAHSATPTISRSPNPVEAKPVSSEEKMSSLLEDEASTSYCTEEEPVIKALSFDVPLEEPSGSSTVEQAYKGRLHEEPPTKEPKEHSETATRPPRDGVRSQLLSSPPPPSVPAITPRPLSSALSSSPALPSLGISPHLVPAAPPLSPSPSAPALILPPPHSPSTRALPPPALSPCPSPQSLPPGRHATSLATSSEPIRVEPVTHPIQSQGSGVQVGLRTDLRCTHTLKAPAGGALVDACCLPNGLYVAAAGKWAVRLWSRNSASEWSSTHTWSFNERVISVFSVPDAAGLVCVSLGQLEIREVRILSCCSLAEVLLCEGLVQLVLGVSGVRVVTSSRSPSGSALQVFTLSDDGSALSSRTLVSPGVCVGAIAPVDGLPDALIGTDEGERLFIWNLRTGQLLQRIVLRDGLSHTACLRGFSYCGVLFVLLQHQSLSSLEEEEGGAAGPERMFWEEEEEEEEKQEQRKMAALLSLVAINPLSGKSAVATRLYPPKAWSGRLSDADASGCSVVGLSHSGCVCVWEIGHRGSSRMVWAPGSEGWQLARWGGGALVTGHHNGDVTLHCHRHCCLFPAAKLLMETKVLEECF